MDRPVKVAVVRSDNRRGAVAQALALLAPELKGVVTADPLVKPNLVSHRHQAPSTHPDVLSAVVEALRFHGAREVTVAEGASDATAGFDRFGHRRELWGQPGRFLDLNREETRWEPIDLTSVRGEPLTARLSQTVAQASCRVSLALAKTHVTSMVTFSLKNMLSCLHPSDRIMMHGYPGGGNGYTGWKRVVVELLKRDNALVATLTRLRGRLKRIQHACQGKNRPDAWRRLSAAEREFLRSVEAMNHNLVALARRVRPQVSVVDGFVAMHGEGPRHGTPIRLGTVIAGTDPVAVDAVAAAVMGFDPHDVGYLHHAHEAGLGVADLDAITILGDPIAQVARRCVPHSNHAVQRHWRRLAELDAPRAQPAGNAPHARPARREEAPVR